MKIVALLKLIHDPDMVEYDVTSDRLRCFFPILDPIGDQVLEEGLRLRDESNSELIVITIAPEDGDRILKRALLSGADRALRLWSDNLSTEDDTWLKAQVIARTVRKIGFDLILCGARSKDTGSEFMACALARLLSVDHANRVVGLKTVYPPMFRVHKKLLYGRRETYHLAAPCVLGLEDGINDPRYVAPHSKTYKQGLGKSIECITPNGAFQPSARLTSVTRIVQSRPRVKKGVNISALSMQDRLKMIRGELGRKKEMFIGSDREAAQKMLDAIGRAE